MIEVQFDRSTVKQSPFRGEWRTIRFPEDTVFVFRIAATPGHLNCLIDGVYQKKINVFFFLIKLLFLSCYDSLFWLPVLTGQYTPFLLLSSVQPRRSVEERSVGRPFHSHNAKNDSNQLPRMQFCWMFYLFFVSSFLIMESRTHRRWQ